MIPKQFLRFLIHYKYQVIFPIAVAEGPIITLISGFLVSRGYLQVVPTFFIVFAGDMISDSFFYAMGRFGRTLLYKIRIFHISETRLAKIETHYKTHPKKTIVISKVSYGLGALFLVAAGASKMMYKKFLEYITLPNALKSAILLAIGYYLGRAVRYANIYLQYYAIAVVILVPLGFFLARRMLHRHHPLPRELSEFPALD